MLQSFVISKSFLQRSSIFMSVECDCYPSPIPYLLKLLLSSSFTYWQDLFILRLSWDHRGATRAAVTVVSWRVKEIDLFVSISYFFFFVSSFIFCPVLPGFTIFWWIVKISFTLQSCWKQIRTKKSANRLTRKEIIRARTFILINFSWNWIFSERNSKNRFSFINAYVI